jgi:ankyrin repeat protein
MKHLLLTTIAAVLVVGCGPSEPLDISIYDAAYDGDIEAVKQHLAAGADVNAKDDGGYTPLDWANSKTETAALLRKHGGKHGTIHSAAGGGDIEAVKEFLAAGADVNAKNNERWTPLNYSAFEGHKEIAELLIANGANVNAKDRVGETPLDVTIQRKRTEIADLIRKHGGKTGAELKAAGN